MSTPVSRGMSFKAAFGLALAVCAVVVGIPAAMFLLDREGPNPHSVRLKLRSVENALLQYSIDNGYPSQAEGLAVLVNPPGGEKPYLEEFPTDPWGNEILYFRPARERQNTFEVASKGPDGQFGTDDDIYPKRKRRRTQ